MANTTLIDAANKALHEAWLAGKSGLPIADHWASLGSVRRFLSMADHAGYQFDRENYRINGYSIRNEAEQVAQFCDSIITNENES